MSEWKSTSFSGDFPPTGEDELADEYLYDKELCCLADCVADLVKCGFFLEDIFEWTTFALYLRFVKEELNRMGEINVALREKSPKFPRKPGGKNALREFMRQLKVMLNEGIPPYRIFKCIHQVVSDRLNPSPVKSIKRKIPIRKL